MGLTLLDSSIVIAWLYADDEHHIEGVAAVERETEKRQNLCMSVVCWAEVLAGTGTTGPARDAAEDLVRGARIAILPVDREVAEAAAPLRRRFGTPDALILATAYLHDDVQRVLTADADWVKARLDGVRVEVVGAGKGSH